MKFADEPTKFMESEIELNNEIQELYAVAASPELYPVLVQSGAVASILGMLLLCMCGFVCEIILVYILPSISVFTVCELKIV